MAQCPCFNELLQIAAGFPCSTILRIPKATATSLQSRLGKRGTRRTRTGACLARPFTKMRVLSHPSHHELRRFRRMCVPKRNAVGRNLGKEGGSATILWFTAVTLRTLYYGSVFVLTWREKSNEQSKRRHPGLLHVSWCEERANVRGCTGGS